MTPRQQETQHNPPTSKEADAIYCQWNRISEKAYGYSSTIYVVYHLILAGCAGRCLSTQLPLATGNKFQRNQIYIYSLQHSCRPYNWILGNDLTVLYIYSLPFSVSHSVSLSFQFYKVKAYDLTRSFSLATRTFYTLSFYFVSDFSISFERRRPKWVTLFKWTAKCVGHLTEQQHSIWNESETTTEDPLKIFGTAEIAPIAYYSSTDCRAFRCVGVYTSPRQHIFRDCIKHLDSRLTFRVNVPAMRYER